MEKGDLMLSIRKAKWIAKAREFIFECANAWNTALKLESIKTYNQNPELMGYPSKTQNCKFKPMRVSILRLTSRGISPPNTPKHKRKGWKK
jgi:hypothetical protein